MLDKISSNIFYILLAFLPISFVIGSSVSLTNVIIFDLFFIIFLFYKKEYEWIKKPIIKILIIFYCYLIVNTFLSIDGNLGIYRNLGFIRLIILFIGINYFFYHYKFNKILLVWTIVILTIVVDVFVEKYFGANILGFGKGNDRVVSFFKDEAIPGGFIFSFSFILYGFFLSNYKKVSRYTKLFILIFIPIILLSVILTGERSNSLKIIIGFLIFIFLLENISFKNKILFCLLTALSIAFFISTNDFLKNRMYVSIMHSASTFVSSFNHGKPQDNPSGNIYAKLYRSGYDIFKTKPIFGVGNKNYRLASCEMDKYARGPHLNLNDYVCNTHPHQVYFEFLSEHGIIGTIILLSLFFLIFFSSIKRLMLENNYIGIGCYSYLLTAFIPLLPSGSFFSDYNISLLFINLSIMYASSKKLNIFRK